MITASSAMEYAFEGDELADARELAPSVFTGALVEGLETGDADRDQDGLVALDELYDYVYDKVRAVTPNQTPGKWTFGVQGELIIARRRRPVTTPTPLPRELQEAMDSPFAAVRAAAVKELVRLLQGSHGGLALGARQAMESLTDDDSRTVSAEATAALRANAPPVDLAEPVRPAEVAAPVASAQVAKPVRQKELAKPVGSADVAEHAPQAEVAVPAAVPPPAQVVQAGPSADATLAGVSPASVDAAPSVAPPVAAPTAPTAPTAATEPTAAKATATTAAPAAATPADGSAAGSTAGSTPPPVDTDDGAASQARDDRTGRQVRDDSAASQAKNDRLLLIAGGLAILGALLTCVGLFPAFVPGVSLISSPTNAWQNFFGAGLDVGAGICLFAPRTRRLIGPGILLSSAAIAAVGPVYDIIVANAYGPAGVGLKLHVVAGVILVVAACLAGLSLARLGEVRVVRMLPEGALPWVVALLGVAGAAALFFQVLGEQDFPGMGRAFILGQDLAPLILTTLLALLVPAAAAVTLPRRFGVALLGAWIAVGVTVVIFYAGSRGNLFGVTLLALVAVIIPFARAAPPTKAERARPAVGNE